MLSEHMSADVLADGGDMGALMRSIDWAKTPLGPVSGWSHALRTTVGLLLRNRFPMLLWWGPQFVQIYNDAYRPIPGAKHPRVDGPDGRRMLGGDLARASRRWSRRRSAASRRRAATTWSC